MDPVRAAHKELLGKLKIGESFFVPGANPSQLTYVRNLGYALKIRLSIRFTTQDPIYGRMGCRVTRVEGGGDAHVRD